jgi:hypothetical protein
MTQARKSPSLILAAGALALAGAPHPALGVEDPPEIAEPGLRDPRVPADIPNISGVYFAQGFQEITTWADGRPAPLLPWNQDVLDERVASEAAGNPMADPTADCLPSGVPRIISAPYPMEIIQTPELTVFLTEVQHQFRLIHMNADHPDHVEPSFMGHSTGRWEGDTLVVDTIGLTDMTHIDQMGIQHTDQLHVIERIRRIDDGNLEIMITMEDPGAFSEPFTARRTWRWSPDIRFLEYVCEENNRNRVMEDGTLSDF